MIMRPQGHRRGVVKLRLDWASWAPEQSLSFSPRGPPGALRYFLSLIQDEANYKISPFLLWAGVGRTTMQYCTVAPFPVTGG